MIDHERPEKITPVTHPLTKTFAPLARSSAKTAMQPCLDQVPFGAKRDSVALEQCLAVIAQLEPLVAIDAAKSAKREAVAELYCLVEQMAPANPQWFKRHCLFQQRLAQMGSNAVLTCVYTTLLSYLEQQRASFAPMADRSNRQSAIVAHRALVDAVASGDAQQAAAAAASLAREWLVPRSTLRKEGLKPSVWIDGLRENDTHVLA